MEYFNIDTYKDWEIDTDYSSDETTKFLKKEDKKVKIKFYEVDIIIRISNTKNPYSIVKSYFLNQNLKYIGKDFYMFHINKWELYDENRKLIKETDYDQPYKFSLKELIEKVKKEYEVDLEIMTHGTWAGRWVDEKFKKPFYEVHLKSKENESKRDYILIDGTTGETSFKTNYYMKDEESIPPFDQYLESLKKAEKERTETYKTYKGKEYTKEEWEAFEEEWYKNYKEKKNSKGFGDDIFNK